MQILNDALDGANGPATPQGEELVGDGGYDMFYDNISALGPVDSLQYQQRVVDKPYTSPPARTSGNLSGFSYPPDASPIQFISISEDTPILAPRRSVSESAITDLRRHDTDVFDQLPNVNPTRPTNPSHNCSRASQLHNHSQANVHLNVFNSYNSAFSNGAVASSSSSLLARIPSVDKLTNMGTGSSVSAQGSVGGSSVQGSGIITDDNEEDEEFRLINKLGVDDYMTIMANLEQELLQEQYNIYFDETEWIQFEENLGGEDYYSTNYGSCCEETPTGDFIVNGNHSVDSQYGRGYGFSNNENKYDELDADDADAMLDVDTYRGIHKGGLGHGSDMYRMDSEPGFVIAVMCPQCR
jgi:hypothetical protein